MARGMGDLPVHFGCEAGIPAHSLASGVLGWRVGLGGRGWVVIVTVWAVEDGLRVS